MSSYNNFNVTARAGETKTQNICVISSRLSPANQQKLREMNEKLGITSVNPSSNQSPNESSSPNEPFFNELFINRSFSNELSPNIGNSIDTTKIKSFTAHAEGQNAVASVDIDEETKKELSSLFPDGNICTATAKGDGAVAFSSIKSFADFES